MADIKLVIGRYLFGASQVIFYNYFKTCSLIFIDLKVKNSRCMTRHRLVLFPHHGFHSRLPRKENNTVAGWQSMDLTEMKAEG